MRLLLATCLLIVGAAIPTQPAALAQKGPLRIAFSAVDMTLPYYQIVAERLKTEADKLGNIQIDVFDAQNKATTQQTDLATIVEKKYDGLIVGAVNAVSAVGPIQAVIDADIPVIVLGRSVQGIQSLASFVSDDIAGGEQQARLIINQFPKGARIVNVQGPAGASTGVNRNKGLHSILDGKSEYPIIFEHTANFRRADAKALVAQALKDIGAVPDVIVTANDEMGIGTVEALKEAALSDKVMVIAYGASNEILSAIDNKAIFATIDQTPGQLAVLALDNVVAFIRDGKQPDKSNVVLPPILITRDNLSDSDNYPDYQAALSATPAATQAATVVPTS